MSAGAGARRRALRRRLVAADLDALLVTHLTNVRYLSGFTGSAGTLLVTADGTGDALATDGRYLEQAAEQAPDLPLVEARGPAWVAAAIGDRRLGVDSDHLAWDAVLDLQERLGAERVVAAPGHPEALRAVKDDAEIAALRRACAVTAAAWRDLLGWLRPGLSERAVARRLRDALEDAGADGLAFDTIVASGPHGARPHHRPGARVLSAGDCVTVDFGAMVDGYRADMTRTAALGEPDPALRRIADLVVAVQTAGVAAVVAGAAAGDVDAACREPITAAGHGDGFLHPTGHGVGLDVHEHPILRPGARATLRPRMAVTVEPGVYVPGLGGVRVEDTVLVTDGHADVLTAAPRELAVL